MRPTTTFSLATALLVASIFDSAPLHAQQAGFASLYPKKDLVQADMTTAATRRTREPFTRTVQHVMAGLYTVSITDSRGQVRMTGAYTDSTSVHSQGAFHYYYPNGKLESHGLFANGIKTGTWVCFTPKGTARADRFYHGMNWDDLQVLVGLSTRSYTGAGAMSCGPVVAE